MYMCIYIYIYVCVVASSYQMSDCDNSNPDYDDAKIDSNSLRCDSDNSKPISIIWGLTLSRARIWDDTGVCEKALLRRRRRMGK